MPHMPPMQGHKNSYALQNGTALSVQKYRHVARTTTFRFTCFTTPAVPAEQEYQLHIPPYITILSRTRTRPYHSIPPAITLVLGPEEPPPLCAGASYRLAGSSTPKAPALADASNVIRHSGSRNPVVWWACMVAHAGKGHMHIKVPQRVLLELATMYATCAAHCIAGCCMSKDGTVLECSDVSTLAAGGPMPTTGTCRETMTLQRSSTPCCCATFCKAALPHPRNKSACTTNLSLFRTM